MSRGYVPQRDEAGGEDWNVMRIDLELSVPDDVLDDTPSLRGPAPRRYANHRPLEGRDVVDFLRRRGVAVGAHDLTTADLLARDLDAATVLTLLSWVRRASAVDPTGG